jgi:hypothetical protein
VIKLDGKNGKFVGIRNIKPEELGLTIVESII